MKGVSARVFAAYPLAIPLAFGVLAYFFPAFVAYDDATGRVTITFTKEEAAAAIAAGYAMIAGVFAKWGIKR
ncbi:MAG: hypothetical protein ACRCSU_04950 [Paracoccaceae bacterium]